MENTAKLEVTPEIGRAGCGYSRFETFKTGKNVPSTLLRNILKSSNTEIRNACNADMQVYGRPYIQTAGGYIYGECVNRSFREQVEQADADWADLTPEQQTALIELYRAFQSAMEDWVLLNVKNEI